MENTCEFGKGFSYCLGLFLAHAERNIGESEKYNDLLAPSWFSGASDHLYDLVIDKDILGEELAKKTEVFRSFCFKCKYESTIEDIAHAIDEAKQLLWMFDRKMGIDAVSAVYK
jgi:hypothetical protein